MNAIPADWEKQLIEKATTALSAAHRYPDISCDEARLRSAYRHCSGLTRSHSKTFFLASSLLGPEEKEASRALYAFCRVSDDIVDRPTGDPAAALANWRRRSLSDHPPEDDPVILAWSHTRSKYRIPSRFAVHLLEGMSQDLVVSRYRTFEELVQYCYSVASTVGLMTMHITGFSGKEAIPYAIKLGVALQLTNILRDVRADWLKGRLYLPQEEIEDFKITEEDIAAGRNDSRWKAFMRFQIERTRRLYTESLPGIAMLSGSGRFAIGAAAELYEAILQDIERHHYDVFSRRAYTTRWDKVRRLPGIWWRARITNHSVLAGPAQ